MAQPRMQSSEFAQFCMYCLKANETDGSARFVLQNFAIDKVNLMLFPQKTAQVCFKSICIVLLYCQFIFCIVNIQPIFCVEYFASTASWIY